MVTLNEVLEYTGKIKPHAFDNDTLTVWINECEGHIQTEIIGLAPVDVIVYVYDEDRDKELILDPPHSKLYAYYIIAMIDFAHGEYQKYENSMKMYNSALDEYAKWFIRTHIRNGIKESKMEGYYISAYGLAVKHGYEGTEEEWLAGLKGEKGDAFVYEDFTDEQLAALKGEKGDPGAIQKITGSKVGYIYYDGMNGSKEVQVYDDSGLKSSINNLKSDINKLNSDIETVSEMVNGKADNESFNSHTSDADIHVTALDKAEWSGKADAESLDNHTSDSAVHVSEADRSFWNEKGNETEAHCSNADIHVSNTDRQNLDENTKARHVHKNMDVLDGITAERVEKWDGADELVVKLTPDDSGNPVSSVTYDEISEALADGKDVYATLTDPSGLYVKAEYTANVYNDFAHCFYTPILNTLVQITPNNEIVTEQLDDYEKTKYKVYELTDEMCSENGINQDNYPTAQAVVDYVLEKNAQKVGKTAEVSGSSPLTVHTFSGQSPASIRFYGNADGLGKKITDRSDTNYKKYQINISVQNSAGLSEHKVYLNKPLLSAGDYVDLTDNTEHIITEKYTFEYGAVFRRINYNAGEFIFADNEMPNAKAGGFFDSNHSSLGSPDFAKLGVELKEDGSGLIIYFDAPALDKMATEVWGIDEGISNDLDDETLFEIWDEYLSNPSDYGLGLDTAVWFSYEMNSEIVASIFISSPPVLAEGENTIAVIDDYGNNSADIAVTVENPYNITGYVDEKIKTKADKADTLAGYGITDAYTIGMADETFIMRSEVDTEVTQGGTTINSIPATTAVWSFVNDYVNNAVSEKLNEVLPYTYSSSKSKETINFSLLYPCNGAVCRFGTLTSLTFTTYDPMWVSNVKFSLYFTFTAGENMYIFTEDFISAMNQYLTDFKLLWHGDDVNANGVFSPVTGTIYEVSIRVLNNETALARVGAVR